MAEFDEHIARHFAATDHFTRTYDDPELWLRLRGSVEKEAANAVRALVDVILPDYPTYREKCGYLRGINWVLKEAAHLTRIEPREE